MRPAGMSSDEEFDEEEDMYFSISKPLRRERNNHDGSFLYGGEEGVENDAEMGRKKAFHRAVEQCDLELMTSMIQNGMNVDESEPSEWTPLMKACARGNHEVVEFLLNNGANPNTDRDRFTPLMACCVCSYVQEEGRLLCVRKLIEHDANVNAQDKYDTTPLMMASASGLDSIVAELLSVPSIQKNLQDKEGWNALFFAVSSNYKAIAMRLVDAGIDLTAVNSRELTALQLACAKGFREIAELLTPSKSEMDEGMATRDLCEPLIEFLHEMPNEEGEGGFHSDVRDLFVGLGMERLYDKCRINVGMHDFLLMGDNLEKLGIHLEPLRWKIKTQGIHRYHVYPWKKSSLHTFERESDFTFEDAINCLANVTKHLSVMCATLKYLKLRIPKRIKGNNSINKEVITSLVNAHVEIENIEKNLMHIMETAKKIPPAGSHEVDLIQAKRERNRHFHYYALFAGSIAAAFLYYRLRLI